MVRVFGWLGEIEPLKALQSPTSRQQTIERVLKEYPEKTIEKGTKFFRLRVNPNNPAMPFEYDSPPDLETEREVALVRAGGMIPEILRRAFEASR
jgi:hypothetical protein